MPLRIVGLRPSTKYLLRVRAVNDVGAGTPVIRTQLTENIRTQCACVTVIIIIIIINSNSLPDDITSASSLSVFRKKLKTHLFQQSYPDIIL